MTRLALFFHSLILVSHSVWCDFVIDPSPPIQVASDNSVVTAAVPIVQTNQSGEILVIWQDGSNDILGSFSSDKGASWTPDNPIVIGTSVGSPFLAANNKGFLLTWVDTNTNEPFSMFYDSKLQTWGSQVPIDPTISASVPIFASATPQGFLATFLDGSNNGYANVSKDGVTWQSSSQIIFPSSANYSATSISGCGTANLLLATWADSSGNLYVATSTDGNSWNGGTSPVLTSVVFNNGSSGCVANDQGFLVIYPDIFLNLFSIFSKDGVNWTSPSLVAPGLAGCAFQTVVAAGNNSGFIAAWVDDTFTGMAAFSSDQGQTWDTPVQFTPTTNVVEFFYYFGSTVAVSQNVSVFAWSDTNQNPYISISAFPYAPTSFIKKSWGFNAQVTPRTPGRL